MKILVLLSRVPYPLIKGDKLRAFHHIKELSKQHEIILCALSDEKLHPEALSALEKYCSKIHIFKLGFFSIIINILTAFFKGLPLQVGYFYNKNISNKIHKIIVSEKPDHLFCQLIRVSEYVRDIKLPKTLDYQDVFSMGIRRRQKMASWILKPIFNLEYKRLLTYENAIFSCFTHKLIISKPDRDLIPHPEKESIHIIPNGVDLHYFKKQTVIEKKYDLLFTGNMAYPPNVNAMLFFAQHIMPILVKHKPDITLLIAGASPAKSIRQLKSKHIHISGWVKDIRQSYAQSKVFVAPMQIGTGLQNKLLEAMAMHLPCVSSELANNALNAEEGTQILIGRTYDAYVSHIINLLDNEDLRLKMGQNAYTYVESHFNWENLSKKITQIMINDV